MLIRYPKPQIGTEGKILIRRIVALFIDEVIIMIVVAILFFLFFIGHSTIFDLIKEEFTLFVFLPLEVMGFFYFIFLEGFMGQTIGKKLMKIVVVKADGSPCTYISSFFRNLLRIIDVQPFSFYLLGGIVVFLTKRKQRIGDLVAKTVVVKAA